MSEIKISRFTEAWRRAEQGESFHERYLVFENWDTLARVLTTKRLDILRYAHGQSARQRWALNLMLDAGPKGFICGMTNRKYSHLTKASPATAQRDLAKLVALRCLALVGAGRSARYEILV